MGPTFMMVDFDAELSGIGQLPPGSPANAAGVVRNRLKHILERRRGGGRCWPPRTRSSPSRDALGHNPAYQITVEVRMTIVGGADGCPGGWICIERDTITGDIFAEVLPSTRELLERGRHLAVLTVDIPIGLTDSEPRECDRQARRLLTSKRGNSVFPAPVRAALDAASYPEACELSAAVSGKRLSKQAHAIMWRIREVDSILRSDPELRTCVREVHPEVCFYAWAGHPMHYAKRTPEGRAERLQLVEEHFSGGFEAIRREIPPRRAADDDILDAFAALWTAGRIVRGMAFTVPAVPLEDRFGLRMEMVT